MQSERVVNNTLSWLELTPWCRSRIVAMSLIEHHGSWGKDFVKFCADNQHIIDAVVYECNELLQAGRTRYSMRTIIEVLRHNSIIRQRGDNVFKINDHCAPDLARLMMILFPEQLAGFFEVRGR